MNIRIPEASLGSKIMPNTLTRHYANNWQIGNKDGVFELKKEAEIRMRSGRYFYTVQHAMLELEIPSRRLIVVGEVYWPLEKLSDDANALTTQLDPRLKEIGLDLGELRHSIMPCRVIYRNNSVVIYINEKTPTHLALCVELQRKKGCLSRPDILSSEYGLNLVRCDDFEVLLVPIDRFLS